MPVSKSVKSKQAPEASAKPKTSKTSTSAAEPAKKASASKPAVKKSAASAAEAKKDTTVVTKSQAELKAMADALLAQATPKRGRKKAEEDDDTAAAPAAKKTVAKKAPAAKKAAAVKAPAASADADKAPAKRGRKPKAKEESDKKVADLEADSDDLDALVALETACFTTDRLSRRSWAHLIAAPTQIGQFRLDAAALLFGEVPGSRVLVHARQGTAGLRF